MGNIQYIDPATQALKDVTRWYSNRLESETQLVRWGNFGVPLLLFPTAGGDAEEVERFFLIKTLEPMIHAGRIKVYSVDSVAGRTWLTNDDVGHCVWIQKQFDNYLRFEVVPAILNDCNAESMEMITAGASIGALNALLAVCRYPEVFRTAICMSGTFDIEKWLQGKWFDDFHHYSPLNFLPHLPEDEQLQNLRKRYIILATGNGENEDPEECWKVANTLGKIGVPNRVDNWGDEWIHDWGTWRAMLPKYAEEVVSEIELA